MRNRSRGPTTLVRAALVVVVSGLGSLFLVGTTTAQKANGQPGKDGKKGAVQPPAGKAAEASPVCLYPRAAPKGPFRSLRMGLAIAAPEAEPNNTTATANALPLGFAAGQDPDVDVKGQLPGNDVDVFSFEGAAGDVLGAACLSVDVDVRLAVLDAAGKDVLVNDNHGDLASLYPPASPLPAGGSATDAALSYVLPAAGRYFVRVDKGPFLIGDSGAYALQLRLRKPPLRDQAHGKTQIIFLDFDGATISPRTLFGRGPVTATLSPMAAFLGGWGLAQADHDPLIDAVVAKVKEHFEHVKTASGNPEFGVSILNSKDHKEPAAGAANVMRVVIGGTIPELGFGTIGIAQFIDPGNFETADNAVVLLDLLSAPAANPNSINQFTLAKGLSKRDAVARVVAVVTSHEIGHLLGCWHCDNANAQGCMMDQGGNLPGFAGVGNDGTMTVADKSARFVADNYADEGISATTHKENTHVRTGYALSTGQLTPTALRVALERDIFQAEALARGDQLLKSATRPGNPFALFLDGGPPAPVTVGGLTLGENDPRVELVRRLPQRSTAADGAFWERRANALRGELRSLPPPK